MAATTDNVFEPTVPGEEALENHPQDLTTDVQNDPLITEFPCSITQERFWLLDRLEPGNPSYNVAVRWRLEGRLSTQLLERAWREIIVRHEVLRTRFLEREGKPVQQVSPRAALRIVEVDLSRMAAQESAAESDRIGAIEARTPFDLGSGPLLRVVLVRHAPTTAVLFVTTHLIISDGWSIGVMARELGVIYEALSKQTVVPLEPLAIQYGDYARWQLAWLQERDTQAEISYWSRQLSGAVPFEVVADRPRPAVPTTNGAIASRVLPRQLTDRLQVQSAHQGVTLFSTAAAALCATLARYTGKTDIVLGTQVSGRDQLELEPMIGQFVNSLILRADVSGAPRFRELAQRLGNTISDALENRHIPIETLLGMVKSGRGGSASPPVSVNFIFQRTFIENRQYSDFTLIDLPSLPAGAIYDLNFFMVERPDGWRFSCQYNTDQFEAGTAERLLRYVQSVLENAVRDPECPVSELVLADPAETERVTQRLRGSQTALQPRTVHAAIIARATAAPEAVAVIQADRRLSFAQLQTQSAALAARLQARGVGTGTRVAICIQHSSDLVIATLATLRAGGTCVILDPASPDLQHSIARSSANLTLISTDVHGAEPGASPSRDEQNATGTAFAWLANSGSEEPHIVEISHSAVMSRLAALRDRMGLGPTDRFISLGHMGPAAILVDCLLPLICGASVVIPTDTETRDGSRLQQAVRRADVTVEHVSDTTTLLTRGADVWALYGGPETAGFVSIRNIQQPHEMRLLGERLDGIGYVLLDAAKKAPPVGAAGKLHIEATGVTPTLLPTTEVARACADGTVEIISALGAPTAMQPVAGIAGGTIDTEMERGLTLLWSQMLGNAQIDPNANFFELGGHSLLAARMLAKVEEQFGRRITLSTLFRAPSVRGLAQLLRSETREFDFRQVVKLHADGANPALIAINNTGVYYLLARHLGAAQPVTSLQVFDPAAQPEKLPATLEEIAAEYVKLILRVHPRGPFELAGWCVAGALAFEIACQLVAAGHEVANLFLIDSWVPRYFERQPRLRRHLGSYSLRWQLARADFRRFTSGHQTFATFIKQRILFLKMVALLMGKQARPAAPVDNTRVRGSEDYDRWLLEFLQRTTQRYEPRRFPGRITLFRSTQEPTGWLFDPNAGWAQFAAQGVHLEMIEGNHYTMFQDPGATQMAKRMAALMTAASPAPCP